MVENGFGGKLPPIQLSAMEVNLSVERLNNVEEVGRIKSV